MIEVRNLYLQQGHFELRDINLIVEEGSFHALIGPTGCGKTTLLESILGLRKIERGQILLKGEEVTKKPPYERGFAYVPQDLSLFPHLTAYENILFGVKYGLSAKKNPNYRDIEEIIKFLRIEEVLHKKVPFLSGGEKQRVALARALAPGYKYLLLDEPFTAIHPGIRKDLWGLLKDLQRKYNLTILMVSHDLEETFFLADYITLMIRGRVIQSERKEVIYNHPATLEVAQYFGIKNIFRGELLRKEEDSYKIWCPDLASELLIPLENFKGEPKREFYFFIRRENIMIVRPDLPYREENLIPAKVQRIDFLGEQYQIMAHSLKTKVPLEIALPGYAFTKLKLKEGDKILLSLRKEKLFTILT